MQPSKIIADLVLLSLFMSSGKYNIPHAPSTGLRGTLLPMNIEWTPWPKGPENITILKE